MLTQRPTRKLTFARNLALAAAGIAAVAGLLVFGLMNAVRIRAQTTQTAVAALPSFEVASIKPSRAGASGSGDFGGNRFRRTGETTEWLIGYAYYDVETATVVRDDQLLGTPRWIYTERFDIDAKVEDSLAAELHKLPWDQYRRQYGLMVQSLLADRFKLKLHHETRERLVYALVVARGGPTFLQIARHRSRHPGH